MARHRLANAQWELIKDVLSPPTTPRRIKDRVGHPRFGLSRMGPPLPPRRCIKCGCNLCQACVTAMREGRKPFAEPELASHTLEMTCPEYRSTGPTTRRAKISLGWVEGQSLVVRIIRARLLTTTKAYVKAGTSKSTSRGKPESIIPAF